MEIKELGHVVLYVRDIERSRHFYGHTLGFAEVVRETPPMIATFSSGRTHHELLLIEVGPSAAPIGPGPRVGLYHIGFKVGDSLEELRAARDRLVEGRGPDPGADGSWLDEEHLRERSRRRRDRALRRRGPADVAR